MSAAPRNSGHSSTTGDCAARGLFCVVEGIDGSGKSTLLGLLHRALEAEGLQRRFADRFNAVRKLREPTGGAIGQRIRTHLQAGDQLSEEAWLKLFFEDRAENVRQNIRPGLDSGDLILQDRYFYSTAAYQASTPEISARIVRDSLAAGFPEPDVVFYLSIEPEAAIERIHGRLKSGANDAKSDAISASGENRDPTAPKSIESFETLEHLTRIHRNYSRILPAHVLRLDAEQPPEQLCEIALARLESAAGATQST